MELTINVNDSCVKKIKALQRLKTMDADELEMFLADGLEGVITASIFEELGMEIEELSFNKISSASTDDTPILPKRPSGRSETVQAEAHDENQHTLSSEQDDDEETVVDNVGGAQSEFSFVDQNIQSAVSGMQLSDDDLADEAMDIGDADDEDEPSIAMPKARKASDRFTKPRIKVQDATYSN
jgi:hypothetical protein